MIRNVILLVLLALVLALPFALRPKSDAPGRVDDTVVVISPHNEAIRHEFDAAFRRAHEARTGRPARIDWRLIGGTSEITRYLEGEYTASFRNLWTARLGRPWSLAVQAAFADGRLPKDAPAVQAAAIRMAAIMKWRMAVLVLAKLSAP